MPELISIIVPVYKVEQYLDQCVESILNQTYDNLEIILIDDGSADGSANRCDFWVMKDPRIHVLHKKNGGLSSARNAGLDICKGKYVSFVDSDDWVEPGCLSTLRRALMANQADISSANIIAVKEEENKTEEICKKEFIGNSEDTLLKLYDQNAFPVQAWNKLYCADIWSQLRFPEGHNYEDAYTTYLAVDLAQKIVHIPELLYNYRIRSGSIMKAKFSLSCVDRAHAWKANYLFCKEKYPSVVPSARAFWLEHIPPLLSQFPKHMTQEEREAKKQLKKEIWENLGFILLKMPLKKVYYQIKGLLFL